MSIYSQDDLQQLPENVRKKIRAKQKFRRDLGSFVLVNTFLFLINITTNPYNLWFIYPLLGWGLGLGLKYYKLFLLPAYEEKELDKALYQYKQQLSPPQTEDYKLDLPNIEKQKAPQKNWNDSELV
jgi:hypothetical protein